MFQLAVYGAEVSVPIVVQVEPPAGARSKTTCWIAVEESEALAPSETTPASGEPGLVSVTDGLSVSTFAVAVTAVDLLPALSLIVKL